jgi:hypothetical protein
VIKETLTKSGGETLLYLIAILLITGGSIFLALRKKRAFFLTIPFLSLFIYFIFQIAMVPIPFFETVKFIFSLK